MRVPIVEPMIESCLKNTCVRPASSTLGPDVVPLMTMRPPGRSERMEWVQVARPTVSITASTRTGSRAPVSNTSCAPMSSARLRFSSSRLVA